MGVKWTASDLLLALELGEPERGDRGRSLQHAFRHAVRGGRFAGGEVLPGTRELALALGMARGTVVEAYEQLIAEGYLGARAGSATFVAFGAVRAIPDPPAITPPAPNRAADLRPGVPDLGSFPADD